MGWSLRTPHDGGNGPTVIERTSISALGDNLAPVTVQRKRNGNRDSRCPSLSPGAHHGRGLHPEPVQHRAGGVAAGTPADAAPGMTGRSGEEEPADRGGVVGPADQPLT